MDYTKQIPTVPGFYWTRRTFPFPDGEDNLVIVEGNPDEKLIVRTTMSIFPVKYFGPYWAGPILPPTTYTGPIGGGVALGIDPTDEDRHCLDNNDLH